MQSSPVTSNVRNKIKALSPNFFDIAYNDYLDIELKNQTNSLSLLEQLYTP